MDAATIEALKKLFTDGAPVIAALLFLANCFSVPYFLREIKLARADRDLARAENMTLNAKILDMAVSQTEGNVRTNMLLASFERLLRVVLRATVGEAEEYEDQDDEPEPEE